MRAAPLVLTLLVSAGALAAPAQSPPDPRTQPAAKPPVPGAPVRDTGGRGSAVRAGTATITGTITTSTGQPAAGARVMIGGEGTNRTTTTDSAGQFSVTGLPMGRYSINVMKPGYVSISYGQRKPNTQGTAIPLKDGESRAVTMQLPRGAVITGMVLDERGEPAINAFVRVLRFTMQTGERRPQQLGGATTDDRGIYRVHSLQPGEYAVCASLRNSMGPQNDAQRLQMELESVRRSMLNAPNAAAREQMTARMGQLQAQLRNQPAEPANGYAPVCFPGSSPSPSATITVAAGEERSGIDLQLQLTQVARIEGTLVAPPGSSMRGIQLMLAHADENAGAADRQGTSVEESGRFVFQNVAPGQYTLNARSMPMPMSIGPGGPMPPPAAAQPRLWATADLQVSGEDINGVVLELQRGTTVSGQLTFQATASPPPEATRAQISMSPFAPDTSGMFMGNSPATVEPNGRFTINDVIPGKYRLGAFVAGGGGWIVESVTVNGEDALDFPLEVKGGRAVSGVSVVMTDRIAELSGTVADQKGQPATEQTLLLYSTDPKYWGPQSRRVRTTRAGADGHYLFRGVPPGDYRLTTLVDPEPGSWYDKTFLEELDSTSVRVTIGEGEKKVEHVRIR